MDKEFLIENNLYEAHKEFQRLCEWGYTHSTGSRGGVMEAGEEDDPNAAGGAPDMGGDPNAAGDAPDMGGDPNAMGGAPDMGGDPNAAGGAPDMGGDPNAMGSAPDPSMDMGGAPDMDEAPEEEEDVIGLDELTGAQEKMNKKINTVGKEVEGFDEKIAQLMGALTKMEDMINSNNAEIQSFKDEFEKRNPTQTEKLNLRSMSSTPFGVKPQDYWEQKNREGGYQIYSDNNEPTTQEYEITNSDVDNFDEREIQDSFNQLADEFQNMDLNRIFGF